MGACQVGPKQINWPSNQPGSPVLKYPKLFHWEPSEVSPNESFPLVRWPDLKLGSDCRLAAGGLSSWAPLRRPSLSGEFS